MDMRYVREVHTERAGEEDVKRTDLRVSVGGHQCVLLLHASCLQFWSLAEKY
jgi:hypothetical protein